MQHDYWSCYISYLCLAATIFCSCCKSSLGFLNQQSYFSFPLDAILWYGRESTKRRAGVVRTVTTQFISHFLLLAMMLQVQELKQPCVEILQRFLCSTTPEVGAARLCGSRAPSWAPSPGHWGCWRINTFLSGSQTDRDLTLLIQFINDAHQHGKDNV